MHVFRYFDELDQKTYLLLQNGPHGSVYTLTSCTIFKDKLLTHGKTCCFLE